MPPDFEQRIPEGDNRPRMVCRQCEFIHYVNPKIVCGVLATLEDRVLLCRRATEPRAGYWTLPAGFMEQGETVAEGAAREAFEETHAQLQIEGLFALYSLAHISQVQIIMQAQLTSPVLKAGPEMHEVRLFSPDELPWADLAFPTVRWSLESWLACRAGTAQPPFANPEGERGQPVPGETS